jgi:hypothetical protein
MTNRIVVPANYTIEVIIKLDPVNGQSELLVRNRSNVQIGMWQIAGLLAEHTANVMKSLLMGKVKQTPPATQTPTEIKPTSNGGNNAT